jgi:hypothetical protein
LHCRIAGKLVQTPDKESHPTKTPSRFPKCPRFIFALKKFVKNTPINKRYETESDYMAQSGEK